MPCILPDPLCVVYLGGHFQLPVDIVVSFCDSSAAAEAALLADHLRIRLLLAATVVSSEVLPHDCLYFARCVRPCVVFVSLGLLP